MTAAETAEAKIPTPTASPAPLGTWGLFAALWDRSGLTSVFGATHRDSLPPGTKLPAIEFISLPASLWKSTNTSEIWIHPFTLRIFDKDSSHLADHQLLVNFGLVSRGLPKLPTDRDRIIAVALVSPPIPPSNGRPGSAVSPMTFEIKLKKLKPKK